MLALAVDLDLGLLRHPQPRPRRVLLARRLRDGHVPDAADRDARRLRRSGPARLHGVPELEGAAVVLVRLQPLLVRAADGGRWCPALLALVFGWLAFRSRVTGVYLSIITQALSYALMLAFFRNDMGFGGNNGFTDFKDILGFDLQRGRHARRRWSSLTAVALGAELPGLPLHRRLAGRPRDPRDPRRREPHAVSRLPRRVVQALGVRRSRRSSPASPARSTCRRSASSTRASSRRSTRSRSSSGWRSAAAARSTAPRPARCSSTTRRRIFTGALPEVWLYALGALFVLVTLFLPRGLVGPACRRERWIASRRASDARTAHRRSPHRQDPLPRAR